MTSCAALVVMTGAWTSCCDLQSVRAGSTDAPMAELEAAADCPADEGVDRGLIELMHQRARGDLRLLDDARTLQTLHAVARRGDADALAALEGLLRDPSPDVRLAVLEALDRLGAIGSLPVLREVALHDPDPAAREMAYHVISSLTEMRVRYLDARSMRKR
ncbi:MAG: HEAT repeat domain-containing protein [Planctomycetes bacterium]|nr:HEAT repeat domain-containing protein [Planctomycetota bacterium]